MPVLAVCLLCTLAIETWPALAAPTGSPEPAPQEELTLLFHGTLQLGQALNSVYRTTQAQLTEAGRSLGLYGHTLELLTGEVSQGQAAAQELHTSLVEIQTEENALQLLAEAMAQALGEVAQRQQVLRDRVRQLEVQLQGAWLGHEEHDFEALKALVDKQSLIVWTLMGHMRRQRREMQAQQQKLRKIQERLHTAALPA